MLINQWPDGCTWEAWLPQSCHRGQGSNAYSGGHTRGACAHVCPFLWQGLCLSGLPLVRRCPPSPFRAGRVLCYQALCLFLTSRLRRGGQRIRARPFPSPGLPIPYSEAQELWDPVQGSLMPMAILTATTHTNAAFLPGSVSRPPGCSWPELLTWTNRERKQPRDG